MPILRGIWRKADAIISYSQYGRDFYKKNGANPKKIFVAHNALHLDHYISKAQPKDDGEMCRLVYIGRIIPAKRILDLLQAYHHLTKEEPQRFSLDIIGDGPDFSSAVKYTESNNLQGCKFWGHLEPEFATTILSATDICVIPGEGGLAINHALMHNLPVVISSGDGTEYDLIENHKNGHFFIRGDIISLASAIATTFTHRSEMCDYITKNRDRLPTTASMVNVFNSLIDNLDKANK